MRTALDAAREAASSIDPRGAAYRCEFSYEGSPSNGTFAATLMGRAVLLDFPTFNGRFADTTEQAPEDIRALLAYHLATSSGAKPTGDWISFSDLPGGSLYRGSWHGYTGKVLAAHFLDDLDGVRAAAAGCGGFEADVNGDVSFVFRLLPLVPLALLYWAPDDEFEARADFLFDSTAGEHLPTDVYAVACKWITDTMIQEGEHHA